MFCSYFIRFLEYNCAVCPHSAFCSFSGYNTVMRIPAGATNIDIKQVSYSGKPEDDNYLGKYAVSAKLWFQATLSQVS